MNITRQQTDFIKGIGITMIVFHNFLNSITNNSIPFNEMDFTLKAITELINSFNFSTSFLNHFLIYFGHYGVQIFVFISGYGLCKSFQITETMSYKDYIIPKIIKIYSLLLFGIFTFFLLFINKYLYLGFIKETFITLTLLRTLSTDYMFNYVGPWWFFSLIVQLYILFPFIYFYIKKYKYKGGLGFYCVNYILLIVLVPLSKELKFPLYGNFIGHLPEFILGILLAMSLIKINWWIILLSLIVFILSNFYEMIFPFSFLTITVLLLGVIMYMHKYLPQIILKFFYFVGSISMFVFIINGPLRKVSFGFWEAKTEYSIFLQSVIHFFFVLLVSYIMSIVYEKINLPNIIQYFTEVKKSYMKR